MIACEQAYGRSRIAPRYCSRPAQGGPRRPHHACACPPLAWTTRAQQARRLRCRRPVPEHLRRARQSGGAPGQTKRLRRHRLALQRTGPGPAAARCCYLVHSVLAPLCMQAHLAPCCKSDATQCILRAVYSAHTKRLEQCAVERVQHLFSSAAYAPGPGKSSRGRGAVLRCAMVNAGPACVVSGAALSYCPGPGTWSTFLKGRVRRAMVNAGPLHTLLGISYAPGPGTSCRTRAARLAMPCHFPTCTLQHPIRRRCGASNAWQQACRAHFLVASLSLGRRSRKSTGAVARGPGRLGTFTHRRRTQPLPCIRKQHVAPGCKGAVHLRRRLTMRFVLAGDVRSAAADSRCSLWGAQPTPCARRRRRPACL